MADRKEDQPPAVTADASDALSIEDLLREAQETAKHAIPASTLRSYRTDWCDFDRWCQRRKISSLPATPSSVCACLIAQARELKTSTLRRRLMVLGMVHKIRE